MKRQYNKIKPILPQLTQDIESGLFYFTDIENKYNISKRSIYHAIAKYGISNNIKHNLASYKTKSFREKISKALTGLVRSKESIENYKIAASKRKYKNNRITGKFKHTEETKEKLRKTSKEAYKTLPEKWVSSCINNPEWYIRLVEGQTKMDYESYLSFKTSFQLYDREVRLKTRKSKRKFLSLIKGENKKGNHLDHKVSVYEGFINNVDPDIIASYFNLEFIPAKDNLSKNKNSNKLISILIEEYNATIK